MTDEHPLLPPEPDEPPFDPTDPPDLPVEPDNPPVEADDEAFDPYASLSAFDAESALGSEDDVYDAYDDADYHQAESGGGPLPPYADPDEVDAPAETDEERLRGPRARDFRRKLRNQVAMLPLAALLIALGGFLLAREQDVNGLPDISDLVLGEIIVLAAGFVLFFQGMLSGRRERGLLFLGLWVWVTAGMLAVLVYGVEGEPDAAQWWPLLLWSLSLTLVLTYLVERTHDARLLLLSVVTFLAGITAYWVTSDRADEALLDTAADYWPLLFSVLGILLLPTAFRRARQ